MAVNRPYLRTCRPFSDGEYRQAKYVLDDRFAKSPEQSIHGFVLLQKDIQELFDYIEPADGNESCYSHRIQELLFRCCVEVEANCRAILVENGYRANGDMKMSDYAKIDVSHRLSAYEVRLPRWHGENKLRKPFQAWGRQQHLTWYQAYNATKHNRYGCFEEAKLTHLIDAICGVVVLLSSQFFVHDFSALTSVESFSGPGDGMEVAIGDYFLIKFPQNW